MPRRVVTLLAMFSIAPLLGAAEVPAGTTPFVPATAAASSASTPAKSVRWELVGILGTREIPVVRINDTAENSAAWLRVGESFGDLRLIAADVEKNTATIQVGSERTVLDLRRVGVTAGAAAPVAPGTASASAATPAPPPALPSTGSAEADAKRDQAIAEREARMLVSDLLEISMIQRKAYEEKQAAAAQAGAPIP